MVMPKSTTKVVRCFAERSEGQWTAVCIDFALAAQADTVEEAINGLHMQIESYLHDACEGDDIAHRDELLSRRAPFSMYVHYYLLKASYTIQTALRKKPKKERLFNHKINEHAYC